MYYDCKVKQLFRNEDNKIHKDCYNPVMPDDIFIIWNIFIL
jgi:hypothetical protein